MKLTQQLNGLQVKVNNSEQKTVNHDLFLKVLAYKSIDIEARSRRCNLVFHGISESKNENLKNEMRDFLWYEMGICLEDHYIHRMHRLGSLYKAKQKNGPDNPRRPVIIAFQDFQSTETILSASYMLRGSGYSVTRDYPREIVTARQRLMPRYRTEKQNSGNKVSIEYPAKLVVNGRTVADEFPDWHQTLSYDRYQLSCGNYSPPNTQQNVNETHSIQQPITRETVTSVSVVPMAAPHPQVTQAAVPSVPPVVSASYAQVTASVAQQQQRTQQPRPPTSSVATAAMHTQATGTFPTTRPVTAPRYTTNSAANQGQQRGSMNTTITTSTTGHTTNTTNATTNTMNYNSSMNSSGNGTRPRDSQTFTNL